jgi:peptidoglycan/LPS O-acetylase OafA/YrhL
MRSTSSRLHWVDHLRTLMILLVVNMHACVTYSHVGSWYYMVDPEPPMPVKIVFVLWQSHLQAFFMGLLFFLAAYFADRSLARRGPKAFLAERTLRLGVPTLIYMLAIHPFILLALNPWHRDFPPPGQWYANYLISGRFLSASGPLWFAFALLIFSVIFAGLRLPRTPSAPTAAGSGGLLTLRPVAILGLGVALGLATFLIRLQQPIGKDVLNFQLCFFPQYIVAFGLGVVISRRDALRSLAGATLARRAGCLALLGGPVFLIAVIALGGIPPQQGANPYFGGWHWQALGLALWEQITGVGLALGALGFCARYLNRDTPLLQWLSDRAFAVYVFHAPVLVALAVLFRPLHANALLMAALLTVAGLAASFIVADLVRRIPGLKEVV